MRSALLLVFLSCLACQARASRVDELVRNHVEAIGGEERIEKLAAMRASGEVAFGGKKVRFTMTAARPNRLRLETEARGRTLVQGTDGVEPAWEFDTGTWPPQYREMREATAKTFVGDAEFDDPLVAGERRGYVLDFAGELQAGERKLLRVLVTRHLTETYSLLLDPLTFFIVMRVEHRKTPGGRTAQVVTHYEDFRPVDGVLLPHSITMAVDGQVTQATKIARIIANPPLTEDTFSRPKAASPPVRER